MTGPLVPEALDPPAAAALTVVVTSGHGASWSWANMQC